ncbi:MAG: DNA replication complex GINS family protein [Candidatus Heimdallarchaeota archaeon]
MAKDDQYKQIFQLWRSERKSNKLLEIKGGMYSTIRQQITSLEKELEKIDSKDKASIQVISARIERLNKILRDLSKLRMHKIIHDLFDSTLNKSGLAAEEVDLVKSLERIFDNHHKKSVLGEAIPEVGKDFNLVKDDESSFSLITVRILKDIPEIADASAKGKTKRSFGPFKKEDVVRLPFAYAQTLIMKNAADRIDLPDL